MKIITDSFQNSEINIVLISGEPWFIAKEIATVLGYSRKDGRIDTNSMIRRLFEDDILELKRDDLNSSRIFGNQGSLIVISEAGLYGAVFGSKKSEAESFKKWITREVLPSIRKTGSYSLTEQLKEKTRDDLISVSTEEMRKELEALDFLLNRVHFSEKEKIEFINKTLEKINFETLENPHLLKHEPVFTLTQLLKDFSVDMRTADFNRKLESYGIIQRFGNGWILLDMKFGENRHFTEGTNHRYYKSTFGELLDLVCKK